MNKVGLCFGKMSSLQDGLSEFMSQLALQFAANATQIRAVHGIEFTFHIRQKFHGYFGDQVNYLAVSQVERFLNFASGFDLWHTLHQMNKYEPPFRAQRQLLTIHDLNFFYTKKGYSFWREKRRALTALRRSDGVVAITNYVRQDVYNKLGYKRPIDVIYNGVRDLSSDEREEVPGLGGQKYLFHISRMAPSKNVDAILRLAKIWPEKCFVLAGSESVDVQRVKNSLAAAGPQNVQVFTNVSDAQKAWLYANCEALLFPSIAEGFGLPPLEAMHFRKPVFLSRLTSLPEVGGDMADYFDDFDPYAMKKVIEARMPVRQRHPQALKDQACKFSWECAADAYLKKYVGMMRG
jgi:glycosyltransferase involved in cell wall biosynthesis